MKILFYINSIHHGGAEKVMVNLANMFVQNGYEVTLVTSFYDKDEYLLNNSVKRLSLEDEIQSQSIIKKNILRIIKLRRICKSEKPDILVSFMAEANFRAILASMFTGIKTLISIRNDPEREYPNIAFKLMAKTLYPLASGCVFQTEAAKKWFSTSIQKKSRIILNQVDEKFYEINYEGKRKNIVTVGRLENQKNHRLLIQAFNMIKDKFPEENLIIYGGGSLYDELVHFVDELGAGDRVIFAGPTMNIQDKIYDSKIFVLSSDYEGLPNAVMEAMTLGIPIVSTDCPCGGPGFLIKDKENGLLVPINDKEALAKAITAILCNESLQNELSINARLRARDFAPEKVFNVWKSYIDAIIADAKEARRGGVVKLFTNFIVPKIIGLLKTVLRFMPDNIYLKIIYLLKTGKKLNLKRPVTYNEKLQWLKLNDRKPEYTQMADKYEVRKYIKKRFGEKYLIPVYGVYNSFDEIDFSKLPNQFVLKCTHDSGGIIICKDKASLNLKKTRKIMNKYLKKNYYYGYREWPYKDIKPRILCEKYMVDESDTELKDYKLLCFNGEVKCSIVCSGRFNSGGLKKDYYDLSWNHMPLMCNHPNSDILVRKPENLNKMIELAKIISQNIPFLRVDFYEVSGDLFFGELTFYDCSGFNQYTPESYDDILGGWLVLQ